jgi:hypothetical protein
VAWPQQQSGGSTITSHEAAFGRVSLSPRSTTRSEQPWFSHQESARMLLHSLHLARVQHNLGNLCTLKASVCPKNQDLLFNFYKPKSKWGTAGTPVQQCLHLRAQFFPPKIYRKKKTLKKETQFPTSYILNGFRSTEFLTKRTKIQLTTTHKFRSI